MPRPAPPRARPADDAAPDIRGLDGERKALVYDNYSKLIAATDTIRRMRASMEPLTPTTSTLEPAVSHIEGVSRELVAGMRAASPRPERAAHKKGVEAVRWALAAPERIHALVEKGDHGEAGKIWDRLRALCDKWEGTKGIDDLRKKGQEALGEPADVAKDEDIAATTGETGTETNDTENNV